ncbi:MAG: hypothetical protein J6T10_24130 [Methanobrevibacter sp.]|nr:hypothetical protein [Methanobrevibacter sp.]
MENVANYKIERYTKKSYKKAVAYFISREKAIDCINSILTDYEKEKTKEMNTNGQLPLDSYYSKHYYYIIEGL